jgi:hypothetical protein
MYYGIEIFYNKKFVRNNLHVASEFQDSKFKKLKK